MKWYFYWALRQLFPAGRPFSFFALVSILGVALGVMVLLIVQSVMNGFVHDIRDSLARTNGDVRVFSSALLDDWREVAADLREREEVEAVTPFAQGIVMVQEGPRPLFPQVWGMDPTTGPEVLPVDSFLVAGTLGALDDRSVFVSTGVANRLGVGLGSDLDVYTPLMLERMKEEEVLLPLNLRVAGIFETGWNEVDRNTILVTLRTMQELYGLGDRVHGLTLRLADPEAAPAVARTLDAELPEPLFARSWMDLNEDFLFVLRLEKAVLFFIMIFIILVASFSIAISLMTTVVRKTREIGLLGAMGGSRFGVGACFCLQGLLIGAVGTVLGVAGALGALHFRNEILRAFASFTGRGDALVEAYGFAYLPVHYIPLDFVLVAGFSLLVSTLAGLLPAWRAARLQPAEALRSE